MVDLTSIIASAHSERVNQDLLPKTPLTQKLSRIHLEWLLEFAVEDFQVKKTKMGDWRKKMKRLEKFAKEDFSDRIGEKTKEGIALSIFDLQNDSLNVVGGFADFAFATAREDILGTKPFFAATPEGIEDAEQAELITKHAHWKLRQTNFDDSMEDIIYRAVTLGTAIPKTTWRRVDEVSYRKETVLADAEGNPLITSNGDYFYPGDEEQFQSAIPEGAKVASLRSPKDPNLAIPEKTQWVEHLVEDIQIVFDNAQTDCIHFDKISADPNVPRLDLLETNVYNEFDLGVLDVLKKYGIPPGDREEILNQSTLSDSTSGNKGESLADSFNPSSNPKIRLVEGYLRVDPLENGNPIRIYIVFCPVSNVLFYADYLNSVTPGGRLPFFAVTCYPCPGSWLGVGFFERYEKVQEYIDSQFSATGYRNRMNSNAINFLDTEALEDGDEIENIFASPGKTYRKKPGMSAKDILEFVEIPDMDNRTIEMMNIMLQVAQMRTGISSAAQGELSALPDTNTATGVNSILSRAATLLKWPVGNITKGLERHLNYLIVLLYANQDFDETFTWGEGRNTKLLKLDHRQAKSLHYHVKVLLTQSHSRDRLDAANAAIGIMAQYAGLQEVDKASQRTLYVQAITALGFENAEEIVREPIFMEEPANPTLPATQSP